jgi:hypothetical protein
MTLEMNNSMMYFRADFFSYLGYVKEEIEAGPVKMVVEAIMLPDGRKALVFVKPEKEPATTEVKQ